jgi:hypothetical protein
LNVRRVVGGDPVAAVALRLGGGELLASRGDAAVDHLPAQPAGAVAEPDL